MKKVIVFLVSMVLIIGIISPINSTNVYAQNSSIPDFAENLYQSAIAVNVKKKFIEDYDKNDYHVSYKISNPAIVSIDSNGYLKGLKKGNVNIEMVINDSNNNYLYSKYRDVWVTDPQLSEKSSTINLAYGGYGGVSVLNISDYSTIELPKSNSYFSSISQYNHYISLQAKKTGTTTLTFIIDGRKINFKVIIFKASINKTSLMLYKNKTYKIKISGSNLGKVTWKSNNNKVATVSNGNVKGKGVGNTNVYATVQGQKIYCYIDVTYYKAYQATNKAISAVGSKYSQAKRMSKGYYDCSSLVWRSYKPYGLYFR